MTTLGTKPLLALAFLAITACGNNTAPEAVIPTPVAGTNVNIGVFNAPTIGAICELTDNTNTLITSQTTGDDGTLNFADVTLPTGLIKMTCTGGQYTDEATGLLVEPAPTIHAATHYTGGDFELHATPLTEIAYQRALADNDFANIASHSETVATAFGLDGININTQQPTDLNTSTAGNDAAGKYGLVLAVISQISKSNAVTPEATITALSNDLDGTDGSEVAKIDQATNSIITAIDMLQVASPISATVTASITAQAAIKASVEGLSPNTALTATTQSITTQEDTAQTLTLAGSNIDDTDDTLSYTISAHPSHGALDGTAPDLTYTPETDYTGADSFTFTVNDGTVDSATATVFITVTAVNDAPTISGTPATSAAEDANYSFTPTGADVDAGDTLSYAITNKPAWASFDTGTGALTGTPANADVGTTTGIIITVTDGNSIPIALATFAIEVSNTNDAPTITGTPATTVAEDANYSFTPTGADVDAGDTLSYAITNKPTWASFDTGTGALTGTPTNADVGTTTGIIITVTDGNSTPVALATFAIEVSNTNDVPTITGTPATTVVEDANYSFTPSGGDVDTGDTLTYAITNKPTWASFDTGTGALTGTPNNSHVGTTAGIIITVTDSIIANPIALASFDIEVETLAVVSIGNASTAEGNAGTRNLAFTITRDKANTNVDINYASSDGTATAGSDYTAVTATTVSFTGFDLTKTVNVIISGDRDIENDETFTVTLSSPVNAKISATNGSATGTITNDDVKTPLNDTGITWAGEYPSGNKTGTDCATTTINAEQDCHIGRDAQAAGTLTKVGAGDAGFDFTKLGANGTVLTIQNEVWNADGSEDAGTIWSCVRDNYTGLIWEVKTTKPGIHNHDALYQWGGVTAQGSGFGTYYNDWNTLVDGSNGQILCGFNSGWRVPNKHELRTIVNLGRANPAIDTHYFPNTDARGVWSSSPDASDLYQAWYVRFDNGNTSIQYRNTSSRVRLVRSGQ